MKKLLFLFVLGFWLLNSCSNDLVEVNETTTRSAGNRTFNIGSISESSLKTPAGLTSLSTKLYKLVHPVGGASGIQVKDEGVGQAIMFIGAFGGQIGQGVACIFAGIVALGCFG